MTQEPDRVGQEPYDADHVILPEIMKANGYTTGMFGKWAGGYEGSHSTPDKRGIDEYYGYICQYMAHRYFPNFLNRYSKSKGDKEVIRLEMTENTQFGDGAQDPNYAKRTQYSGDMIHQEATGMARSAKWRQTLLRTLYLHLAPRRTLSAERLDFAGLRRSLL